MPEQQWRRNSLRYPGYDYSQPGITFVTICTHQNQRLFGDIEDGAVQLSPAGLRVSDLWGTLSNRFPDILVDEYIVMPDHLHGILMTGSNPDPEHRANSVGYAINSFKNAVHAAWRNGVVSDGWPRYARQLWHRDYYDRIVRNDAELDSYREYIAANPARWEEKRRQVG